MHRTNIDLSKGVRKDVCALLSVLLADAIDLQSHAKQAHWNVKGPNFIALHELFDKVSGEAGEYADTIAERIAQLGGQSRGTIRAAAKTTTLKEYPLDASDSAEHVRALAASLAAFGKRIRAAIEESDRLGDKDAADICTEISRSVDKYLWFVESHAV